MTQQKIAIVRRVGRRDPLPSAPPPAVGEQRGDHQAYIDNRWVTGQRIEVSGGLVL